MEASRACCAVPSVCNASGNPVPEFLDLRRVDSERSDNPPFCGRYNFDKKPLSAASPLVGCCANPPYELVLTKALRSHAERGNENFDMAVGWGGNPNISFMREHKVSHRCEQRFDFSWLCDGMLGLSPQPTS